MTISLSQATKSRIITTKAPLPTANIDPNIGKKASVRYGPYADLQGIVYPRYEGIKYVGEFGQLIIGDLTVTKPYLLMFFYDDGTFFCAIEAELADMVIVGGTKPPPTGDGTPASPFECGVKVESGNGTAQFYHRLPNYAGLVKVYYNMYGAPDTLDIYYIDDLTTKIASTNGPKVNKGSLTFYFDPAFDTNKILVKISDGIAGTAWEYNVDCPIQA